ncbi:DUF6311 domain-containing protein [Paenibacillus sp. RC67]|uniref:DUF6311 domain-containing protein n=1 Tax=Paenibacillus sp. RC67 TaxID=3039392 RepID=UPI0024AE1C9F|nr:DUF6311 domain-containing protein [Paenibacillus sp. RC67]
MVKIKSLMLFIILILLISSCLLLDFRIYYPLILCFLLTMVFYYFEENGRFLDISHTKLFLLVLSVSISGLYFLAVLGSHILNYTYIDWLLLKEDPAQHYIGWQFFRNEPWSIPFGKIESFGYPLNTSIFYTDSVPLLAFIFKTLNPVLPPTFQYMGYWMLICYILQGFFGLMLIRKITHNTSVQILAAMFFVISPIMLWRAYGHEALMGHWVILASILLFINKSYFPFVKWLLLITVSLLVHPYIFIMILGLFFVQLFELAVIKKVISYKILLIYIIIISINIIFLLWSVGYFTLGKVGSTSGYGDLSFNLTSLFNPQGWSNGLIKDRSLAISGQYEGFSYFGVGIIVILLWAFFQILNKPSLVKPIKNFWVGLSIVFVIYFAIATSNVITLDNHILANIKLNENILALLGTIRASGRMIWPLYYMIIFFSLYILIRGSSKKVVILLLSFSLFIQYYDLSSKMQEFHKSYNNYSTWNNPLKSAFWNFATTQFDNIVFVPLNDKLYLPFSYLASNNNMKINIGYFARQDYSKRIAINTETRRQLLNGVYDTKTLYIIDKSDINSFILNGTEVYNIDGYFVFIPTANLLRNEINNFNLQKVNLNNLINYKLGDEVKFGLNGVFRKYSLSGWEESSGKDGTWTEGHISELRFFLQDRVNEDLQLNLDMIPLINHKLDRQMLIISINDKVIWEGPISRAQQLKVAIPNNVLNDSNQLYIKFQTPSATSPKDMGINEDTRILGLHFRSLIITRFE